jgi:hypothetical protein
MTDPPVMVPFNRAAVANRRYQYILVLDYLQTFISALTRLHHCLQLPVRNAALHGWLSGFM